MALAPTQFTGRSSIFVARIVMHDGNDASEVCMPRIALSFCTGFGQMSCPREGTRLLSDSWEASMFY